MKEVVNPTVHTLGSFQGIDFTRPVQVFLQIDEFKAQKERWTEEDKIRESNSRPGARHG